MMTPVMALKKILEKEVSIYREVLRLEEEKGESIINRDGKQLEAVTREQENLLKSIGSLEEERITVIKEYSRQNHLEDLGRPVTLKDVVTLMDEDSAHTLMGLGLQLKRKLQKLGRMHETNQVLIQDNLEFFNLLISGLKDAVAIDDGYGPGGDGKQKVAGSLMFNKTV